VLVEGRGEERCLCNVIKEAGLVISRSARLLVTTGRMFLSGYELQPLYPAICSATSLILVRFALMRIMEVIIMPPGYYFVVYGM
jgi:hypothetical protein